MFVVLWISFPAISGILLLFSPANFLTLFLATFYSASEKANTLFYTLTVLNQSTLNLRSFSMLNRKV